MTASAQIILSSAQLAEYNNPVLDVIFDCHIFFGMVWFQRLPLQEKVSKLFCQFAAPEEPGPECYARRQ